ncbi:ADP-ribosylglycohydrolase family protein [Timonella sp. A28]|uniref:ADP-ribosylglycohydrolase family protein n=1 Tax=Timonella sp. A28 TaxID=3442640 RepID=UPI003EBF8AC5
MTMRLTWAQPEDLVPHEIVQSRAEGKNEQALRNIEARWTQAGGQLEPPVSGAGPVPATQSVRLLARELLTELDALPPASHEHEPNEFEQILALAPSARPTAVPDVASSEFRTRVAGAWLGRAAGCLLGKPVEKIPRTGIEAIARATGNWPLDGYFTAVGLPQEIAHKWPWNRRSAPTSLVENIVCMPEDDDMNFPILGLAVVAEYGHDFTTEDIATAWLNNLPGGRVFTAERAAYRNILDARSAPETATHLNPFREWIGALIRGDVFGWVNPGQVRHAARQAWTDARLSHTRNGIYGEMWAAAAASAAVSVPVSSPQPHDIFDSIEHVLELSLSVIPQDSQMAQAVRFGARVGREEADLAAGLDRIHAQYGHLHWVHTLNNAAAGAFALTHSRGDYQKAITAAVAAGWDTDSIGATVGGIVGGLLGSENLPHKWVAPLNGQVVTSIPGGSPRRFDDLISQTIAHAARHHETGEHA